MVYPEVGQIPESKPAVTSSGKPTIHKRTKTERNELYAGERRERLRAAPRHW